MNQAIFFFFYNFAHTNFYLDKLIVFFAVYFPFVVIILAGLFLLFHHDVFRAVNPYKIVMEKKKEISLSFFCGALAWVIAQIFKLFIHTARPFDAFANVHSLFAESGYSFPSGHATFFMALAVSLFFYHKKVGYLFMIFALIIGLARIAGGVHFPADILGGFALGALVAYFVKSV